MPDVNVQSCMDRGMELTGRVRAVSNRLARNVVALTKGRHSLELAAQQQQTAFSDASIRRPSSAAPGTDTSTSSFLRPLCDASANSSISLGDKKLKLLSLAGAGSAVGSTRTGGAFEATDTIQIAVSELDHVAAQLEEIFSVVLPKIFQQQDADISHIQGALFSLTSQLTEATPMKQDADGSNLVDDKKMMELFCEVDDTAAAKRRKLILQREIMDEEEERKSNKAYRSMVSPLIAKQLGRKWKRKSCDLGASPTSEEEGNKVFNASPQHPSACEVQGSAQEELAVVGGSDDDKEGSIPSEASMRHVALVKYPPIPYGWTPFPIKTSASWWHRVIHHLQHGKGTSVLRLEGSIIASETVQAMRAEMQSEPACLHSMVEYVLTQLPFDSRIYLVDCVGSGTSGSDWKSVAKDIQFKRLARGHPILASQRTGTSSFLLAERLQFSADRPSGGLLEVLRGDQQPHGLWLPSMLRTTVSSVLNEKVKPLDVIVPPLGQSIPFFSTADPDAKVDEIARPQTAQGSPLKASLLLAGRPPSGMGMTARPTSAGSSAASPISRPTSGGQSKQFRSARLQASGEWVSIDVSPHIICPFSYALVSVHPFHAGDAPRHWVLEGSGDGGVSWTVLCSHVDDRSISGSSDFAIFDIPPVTVQRPSLPDVAVPIHEDPADDSKHLQRQGSFSSSQSFAVEPDVTERFCGSQFRIRSTGKNARSKSNLQIAGIEFYGRLLAVGRMQQSSHVGTPASQRTPTASHRSTPMQPALGAEQVVSSAATPRSSTSMQNTPRSGRDEELTSASVFGARAAPMLGGSLERFVGKKCFPPFTSLPPPPVAKGGKKK